jgi:pimeloyl-ACP methyl ester carboxylesterase
MEQRARIDDTEIAYEIGGEGPRLVWAHGLASCREGDRDLIDAFEANFTVLSYDARGHGRSAPVYEAERMNYPKLGADLLAMLDLAGWDSDVVLAGASMGAATCARVACLAPERVRALVAARPAAAGDDGAAPPWLQLLFAGGAYAIRTGGMDAAVDYLMHIPQAREELERDPARLDALRRDWGRHDPLSIATALESIPRSIVLDGLDISMVRCPVLVVPGNDLIHPMEAGIAVARTLANATLAEPFDSLPREEEVRAFVDLVRKFAANVA